MISMYQSLAHCPSSNFSYGYGNQDYYGGKSSCSHGHAHGPSDMPLMSINLEFSADMRQQPRSTMMPDCGGGDHLHFRLQCDQVHGNLQLPSNYTHDTIGRQRQHCCCRHVPPQAVLPAPAPELMHHHQSVNHHHSMSLPQSMNHPQTMNLPPSMSLPQSMSHLQPINYPQSMSHLQTVHHSQPMNHPPKGNYSHHLQNVNYPHPQPMNQSQQMNYPQTIAHHQQITHSQPINPSHSINYHHPMNHPPPRNSLQSYMPPLSTVAPPAPKDYNPSQSGLQSSVSNNCASASININIGGSSCFKDKSVYPNYDAGYIQNVDHALDCDKHGIPLKPENIPIKSAHVNNEYLNCLNAITRSHAEWFGQSNDGASQVTSNSLFNPAFPQNSNAIESPWLPTNLDDKDFRLILIFLQKSRQPIHYVN